MDSHTIVTLHENIVDIVAEAECDIFFFLMVWDSILKTLPEAQRTQGIESIT